MAGAEAQAFAASRAQVVIYCGDLLSHSYGMLRAVVHAGAAAAA